MPRPSQITCSCGSVRSVPAHGAIPKRCVECQRQSLRERNRKRMVEYARRKDVKARRRRIAMARGFWNYDQ